MHVVTDTETVKCIQYTQVSEIPCIYILEHKHEHCAYKIALDFWNLFSGIDILKFKFD